MIEIPFHPDYRRNQEQSSSQDAPQCVVCYKAAANPKLPRVHMWYGTQLVTEAEAAILTAQEALEGCSGDMGYWPIGRDCLRKHPELRPYLITE